MTTTIGRTKLARDLESLARRFDAATARSAPWTPAAAIVATALSRLVAMISAWGTPSGQRIALRIADAFAPVVANVARLAEIGARFIPAPRALELARNIAAALADGIEAPEETIVEMVGRIRGLGLALEEGAAASLVAALAEAANAGRSQETADLDALGAAIGAIGRAASDAAVIQKRMRGKG